MAVDVSCAVEVCSSCFLRSHVFSPSESVQLKYDFALFFISRPRDSFYSLSHWQTLHVASFNIRKKKNDATRQSDRSFRQRENQKNVCRFRFKNGFIGIRDPLTIVCSSYALNLHLCMN